jgi:hypothetical protein
VEFVNIAVNAFGSDWNEPPWRQSVSLGSCYFQSQPQD